MSDEMIIDGEKLADYLKEHGVSKQDLVEVLNTGEIYYSKEDREYGVEQADTLTTDSLYKKGARLSFLSALKLSKHIGDDHLVDIIDWEAMGFEYNEITVGELLSILKENHLFHAN